MTEKFDGEKFVKGREGGDYYSGFYVDWLEERIATLEQNCAVAIEANIAVAKRNADLIAENAGLELMLMEGEEA